MKIIGINRLTHQYITAEVICLRLSCGSRGLAFFAVILLSFLSGGVFGGAVYCLSSGSALPATFELTASGFVPIIIGTLLFPLAVFFLGFSASGIMLIPVICVIRGFAAALCACVILGASGLESVYWIYFAGSSAACCIFIVFAFFALRSSSCIIQNLLIPEARSFPGFGEYIKSSALLFAIIIAIGALEFFSVPMII
ncbi:MAG: hypothetical protein IJP43_02230 [Oscillospiraceae bacterium]|nr:hypothetical protein [Oscillospiraceae bacterium]